MTAALAKPILPKISLRVVRETPRNYKRQSIISPFEAAQFLSYMAELPEEHFVVIHLNSKNEPQGITEVSHGTLSASLVHPREVFKTAIALNTHSIILAHNHPSGSKLEPSLEDIETTKQLIEAGDLLGIAVMDHVIIGGESAKDADFYSMREYRFELWKHPRERN